MINSQLQLDACCQFIQDEVYTVMQKNGCEYDLVFPDTNSLCFAINVDDNSFNPNTIKKQLGHYVTLKPGESDKTYMFYIHPEKIKLDESYDDTDEDTIIEETDEEILSDDVPKPNIESTSNLINTIKKKNASRKFLWIWSFIAVLMAWFWYHFVQITFENHSWRVAIHL